MITRYRSNDNFAYAKRLRLRNNTNTHKKDFALQKIFWEEEKPKNFAIRQK